MFYQGWWTLGRWGAWNGWAAPPAGPARSSAGSYHCSSWSAASLRAGCRPRSARWHSTPLGWCPHLTQENAKVTAPACGEESFASIKFYIISHRSPFSTLVRSLPCFVFSNRGWWPSTSSPDSLQDLSNRAPSPHGAVLWTNETEET